MTPLFMIFLIGILVGAILIWFLTHSFGFKRAVRYLFFFGLLATFTAMTVLPKIFPALDEGLGIGLFVYMFAGPALLILGALTLIFWIIDLRKAKNNT